MQNLEQRSPEWHAWRREGIGSSEAAILMGCTQFRTLKSLWREKCGLETHYVWTNQDMQRGIDNEDLALEKYQEEQNKSLALNLYSKKLRLEYKPLTLQHPKFSFLRASLDGAHPESRSFVEIKCPRLYIHEKTKLYDVIKDEYFCQMQHQYLVTDYVKCDFISYEVESEDLVWLPVEPDLEYMAELLDREIKFWQYVVERQEPDILDFPLYTKTIQSSQSSIEF